VLEVVPQLVGNRGLAGLKLAIAEPDRFAIEPTPRATPRRTELKSAIAGRNASMLLGATLTLASLAGCGGASTSLGPSTEPRSTTASTPVIATPHETPALTSAELNGRIVFERFDAAEGATAVFLANADGTDVHELFDRGAEWPHWSPDGREISIFCCDDGMAAHIVDSATGGFRELPWPDKALEVHCGPWTADGRDLACESFGVNDPKRNGVWMMRSRDGGGLTRLTSNPGGDDVPGDFSPDGKHMVFARQDPSKTSGPDTALFVLDLATSKVMRITPWGSTEGCFCGAYSPDGSKIVFADARDGTIWVVAPDGSSLTKIFADAGGRFAITPAWSPDGKLIIFALVSSLDLARHPNGSLNVITTAGMKLTEIEPAAVYQSNPDWAP
jgi:Tol biopolymer transport system component